MKDKLALNVNEVSALLGLSRASAYQGIATGDIPHIKIGRRILVPVRALEAKLAEAGKARGNGKNSAG